MLQACLPKHENAASCSCRRLGNCSCTGLDSRLNTTRLSCPYQGRKRSGVKAAHCPSPPGSHNRNVSVKRAKGAAPSFVYFPSTPPHKRFGQSLFSRQQKRSGKDLVPWRDEGLVELIRGSRKKELLAGPAGGWSAPSEEEAHDPPDDDHARGTRAAVKS